MRKKYKSSTADMHDAILLLIFAYGVVVLLVLVVTELLAYIGIIVAIAMAAKYIMGNKPDQNSSNKESEAKHIHINLSTIPDRKPSERLPRRTHTVIIPYNTSGGPSSRHIASSRVGNLLITRDKD